MKKILVKIYSYIRNRQKLMYWGKQVSLLRKITCCKELKVLDKNEKYLILLPHVDDEWIGASSLISNSNYNLVLCNMNMPGGDSDELHKIRAMELSNLASTYSRRVCNYDGNIEDVVETEKPGCVMLPFFIDWHNEHIKVMEILFNYLQSVKERKFDIVMYQVSVPIPENHINRIAPLSESQYNNKWEVFRKIYLSQKKIPYQRFAFNERISGAWAGSYAAEVFVKMGQEEWLNCYQKLTRNGRDYLILKQYINDLQKIRLIVSNFS